MNLEVKEDNNIRLDKYLALNLDITRNKIQELIDQGKILVNGKCEKASYKVQEGDNILVNDELDFTINIEPQDIPIDIIYENDDLLVINKPSGMVVHPAPGNYSGTLVNALLGKFSLSNDNIRPGIVHRLDKDTSGLMLVAKNDWAHDKLSKMIKEKKVKRIYLALVDGVINHDTGTIEAPIGRDPSNREKMMVTDVNSKEARTHFKVLKRYKNHTLIECILDTGRTHQIRVHMKYIGYPVTNDPLYGKCFNKEFGQMLHSKEIVFNNPRDGEIIHYTVEPPEEFKKIINKLEEEL